MVAILKGPSIQYLKTLGNLWVPKTINNDYVDPYGMKLLIRFLRLIISTINITSPVITILMLMMDTIAGDIQAKCLSLTILCHRSEPTLINMCQFVRKNNYAVVAVCSVSSMEPFEGQVVQQTYLRLYPRAPDLYTGS